MTSSGVIQDFGKYLLTGVISFIASFGYTEYRFEPTRNVSLVPISISFETSGACTVDPTKLNDAIKRIDPSGTTSSPSQSDSYKSYLIALSSNVSKLVLKENVPVELLPRLENERVLICNQEVPPYATFSLEAAALFDQPTAYLLKRSCSVLYQGVEIPIRASAQANSTIGRVTELETVPIRETGNLIFHYDERRKDRMKEKKFIEMKEKVSREGIELSVKCHVISPYNDKEIGGQRSYLVSSLPPS